VLTSLTILGDTSLKLTSTGCNDKDSTVGLRSARDHVLDEVTVTGGIWQDGQWTEKNKEARQEGASCKSN
jgi:hypothetical protein